MANGKCEIGAAQGEMIRAQASRIDKVEQSIINLDEKLDILTQAFIEFKAKMEASIRVLLWVMGLVSPLLTGIIIGIVLWAFNRYLGG